MILLEVLTRTSCVTLGMLFFLSFSNIPAPVQSVVIHLDEDNTADQTSDETFVYRPYSIYGKVHDEPQYVIFAPKRVHPGQIYRVVVTILWSSMPLITHATLKRGREEVATSSETIEPGSTTTLLMKVPLGCRPGNYVLQVEGNINTALGGTGFSTQAPISFSKQFLTILIQTNKLVYNYEQAVRIRVILLTTELKPYSDPVDIYLLDSRGFIMKRWVSSYPFQGFINVNFTLPEDYTKGWWKVRVVALDQVEEKSILLERWFTNRFDVNVSLPAFTLKTETHIEGTVTANHTNLAPVRGNATVKAIVKPLKKYYRQSLSRWDLYLEQTVALFEGSFNFNFRLADLEMLIYPHSLKGCEVEVQAWVGERFLDTVVMGYARTRIIDSTVKIRFLGIQPLIFKPGMPFEVYIAVSYHDQVPLEPERLSKAELTVQASTYIQGTGKRFLPSDEAPFEDGGIAKFIIEPPIEAERLQIVVKYEDELGSASSEIVAISYYSPMKRFIQVTTSTAMGVPGQYGIFHVRANFFMKNFQYLVVSKGSILISGTEKTTGMLKSITTFAVSMSTEMAPTCRVIVYHVTPDGDVIADSVTLPVKAVNREPLSLDITLKQDHSGNHIELVPELTREAMIGISAFDEDMMEVQSRNDLTPLQVTETMLAFEEDRLWHRKMIWRNRRVGRDKNAQYFSTPNYGRDTNQTFTFSGLVIFTNLNISRILNTCNASNGYSSCVDGRCYLTTKKCDGIKDCSDGTDEGDCGSELEDQDIPDFFLYRRNRMRQFYEATGEDFTWLNVFTGYTTDNFVGVDVPIQPRNWIINAVGMSKDYGLSILETPIQYDSTRPFFMTVEAPKKISLGEQIGVRLCLFNYQRFEIMAEIILKQSPDYRFVQVEPFGAVSSYQPRTTTGDQEHLVFIPPHRSIIVPFPVVPTKRGLIKIVFIARTQVAKQTEILEVEVVPDGVPVSLHTAMLLDLRAQSYILKYTDILVADDPIIPFESAYRRYIFGSPKATVSVIGDVVGAPLSPTFIETDRIGLPLPVKSGEHAMFNFAYNLYTLIYLRLTNQWPKSEVKNILEYLNKAYIYQMTFYKAGAFTMFRKEPSVWLSAYCARIYRLAQYPDWEHHLYIDPSIIWNAIQFVLKHQTRDGSFYETTNWPWNRKMGHMQYSENEDSTNYNYRNVSLTAHVLITLAQVADLPGKLQVATSNAKNRAISYLERLLPQLTDPYEVAIVTYALMEASSMEAKTGYNMLERMKREKDGLIYWSPDDIPPPPVVYQNQRPFIEPRLPARYDSIAVEATAYALMVYVRFGGLIEDNIVRWLNTMRRFDVGFVTTQDTIVATQALIEYSYRTNIREVTDMNVLVESSSNPERSKKLTLKTKNLAQPQFVDIFPNVWGHVSVTAQGSGLSILQLNVEYNVDRSFLLVQPPVRAFDLTIDSDYYGRNHSHIDIKACARWNLEEESNTSGVAVLEISLPTGYLNFKPSLDSYIRRSGIPQLRRGRVMPRLAVFMFDYLDNQWTCVEFTIERWYPVANLTRYLRAKVFDFYTPEYFEEVIYEDVELFALSICDVCGSYQCPFCPFFSKGTMLLSSRTLVAFILMLIFTTKSILR